ncbi:DUF4352 domain-containing protein [Halomarina ordinaria]|uniref:DUF4352 domain-containing protein n=1 Tax=Halomarina ordinaria TaxID=3033939 RepID=A0ABD5U444_9EURY|nr:DUF4352 domain-containing protein [Halomarina sp. PSRA2]
MRGRQSDITRRELLLGGATAGTVVLAGCASGDGSLGGGSALGNETTPTAAGDGPVGVGRALTDGASTMVVRSVERTTDVGGSSAREGWTYLVVDLAVKNESESVVAFGGFVGGVVRDGSGETYERSGATGDGGGALASDHLVPGEVVRGPLVYEVPADAEDLTLVFDLRGYDGFDHDRVEVDLDDRVARPAVLDQDLAVEVREPGSDVTREGVTVAVEAVRTATGGVTAAPEGTEYVIPTLRVENRGDEPLVVSNDLQTAVKDGTGRAHERALSATAALPEPFDDDAAVAPGDARRGELAYAVPTDAERVLFAFDVTALAPGAKEFWALR